MNPPTRVLDLFCGAGGAAMGYHWAWPEAQIIGVDISPQPHYPFEFVQADALTYPLDGFDFIHASPPCQGYSRTRFIPAQRAAAATYPKLVEPLQERLRPSGIPYVIENTWGAPLRDPIVLCGAMFPPLRVYRHRYFECSFPILAPSHVRHVHVIGTHKLSSYIKDCTAWVTVSGHLFSLPAGSAAMGIDWMTRGELAQAIPPTYTQWIGEQYVAS